MTHIKESEVEMGCFYMAANNNPYVREVTQIADRYVLYNDYLYQTGEHGLVNQCCTKRRFATWATRKLTNEEAARMQSAAGHARANEEAAVAFMVSQQGLKMVASWLALAVRNEIEDFHAYGTEQTIKNTDDYMPEFNRLVRNAIYTGLYAIIHSGDDVKAKLYANWISRVPDYWEEPELTLSELDEVSSDLEDETI